MNYIDLARPNSPQMVVDVGNSPPTTARFRWVKYYNPRSSWIPVESLVSLPEFMDLVANDKLKTCFGLSTQEVSREDGWLQPTVGLNIQEKN